MSSRSSLCASHKLAGLARSMSLSAVDTAKAIFSKSSSKTLKGHVRKVLSVNWSSAGKLASGSSDYSARVWDVEKSKSVELLGHSGSVEGVCWNPTAPHQLITASVDKTVKLWDARAVKCTHSINTKGENINTSWSPDGMTIGVGNKDDVLTWIDVRKLSEPSLRTVKYPFEVNEFMWTPDGQRILMPTGVGFINVLSSPDLKNTGTVYAHAGTIFCMDVDRSGRYIAVGAADALVSLWDCNELICLRTFRGLECPVRAVSFSFDGSYLACGSEDPYIEIAHVESGESVCQIKTSEHTACVAWHPKKLVLAHAGDDKHERERGGIKIWGV